ncbi:aminodeoxychorismate lyase [Thiomicrospira pelophila]|uniref:aminodeoxychorismate lyase n=1 Tax=Thiomicrospira pelophila TaxID=934 RepID=UPI00068A496F|nr:aminodeoxychorismate lyase [Thiomicrospira pelophila]
MNQQAWLNGEPTEQLLAYDRGLAYGDGFFTTILCYQKKPLNWLGHWQRIQESLQTLRLGEIDKNQLINELQTALYESASDGFCILKLIVTRGTGGRGYAPPKPSNLHRLIYVMPTPFQPTDVAPSLVELSAMICQTAASINPSMAGLKHLNRLENVLARNEVVDNEFDEGLMFNEFGHLVGGTQSNIVLINQTSHGRQALTPKLDLSGVKGTCLSALKNLSLDLNWQEKTISLSELRTAEAVFVCNAVRGVQAIKQLIISDKVAIDYAIEPVQMIHQAWWLWNLNQPGFD